MRNMMIQEPDTEGVKNDGTRLILLNDRHVSRSNGEGTEIIYKIDNVTYPCVSVLR